MSLDRFANKEDILTFKGPKSGITWREADVDKLGLVSTAIRPKGLAGDINVEMHLYSLDGSIVESIDNVKFVAFENNISINLKDASDRLSTTIGNYDVIFNFHANKLDNLYIKEISPDRRELIIKSNGDLSEYLDTTSDLIDNGSLVLNFGGNRIYTIINQRNWEGINSFAIRLLKPLDVEIEDGAAAIIDVAIIDPQSDNIEFVHGVDLEQPNKLRGPNFDIDPGYATITETDFKSWNNLLDTNTSTSQQIVDKYFSGSITDTAGIDYSGFENFVFYSSAVERLANFKYKLELVEYYDNQLSTLNNASGSSSSSLQKNITVNTTRKNSVIGSFDGFERWLYNDPTSSLFTNQPIYDSNNIQVEGGSIGTSNYRLSSYPKYLSGSKYYLHPTTSTIATNWFNGFTSTASLYDSENETSLAKTIPEHIRLDENNDQYTLFVNMIGHHFDILYSYANALAKTYHPIEHPKLGASKETLYNVAKSLGWTLADGKQASQLWQYKLGVDSGSGAYQTTGSLFSKSDEEITTEVWRRIVNNLPYLLKTKGTARSVKALMNTYGIPQTLLSVREYGGPKVSGEVPTLIEDRFSYALQFNTGSYLEWPNKMYNSDIGNWGYQRPYLSAGADIPDQTREFRFKPAVKADMLLYSNGASWDYPTDVRMQVQLAIEHTASYSGSDQYGRVHLVQGGAAGATTPMSASTGWVPLYDGNFWNLRYYWTATGSDAGIYNSAMNLNTTYHVQVQQASDYISGKIIHSSSLNIVPTDSNHYTYWSSDGTLRWSFLGGFEGATNKNAYEVNSYLEHALTGTTSGTGLPGCSTFSGSMQEYREWMEELSQATFDLHTLNPTSYVSSINATSSYDTLVRHYPLGTDLYAVDRSISVGLIVSSSHPANDIKDFTDTLNDGRNTYATASGFITPLNSQRGNYEPVEETYYVQGVSLGGNLPKSQKIRLEKNKLIRQLSTTSTSERSSFDLSPTDSHKLGLFYSVADQINKEIFNHIGDVELDDYIGDPDHRHLDDYPDLSSFSKEYWKKYTDKNDINAFIRIFSQFDFALFGQIKQLLPERVDDAMGLLIEPHAIERAKVRVSSKLSVTNPQYNAVFESPTPSGSGEEKTYSGAISRSINLSADSIYNAGSNGYADTGNHLLNISTLGDVYAPPVYKHIYTEFPYKTNSASAAALGLPLEITSSLHILTTSPTGSIIDIARSSNVFKKVVFHYGTGSAVSNKYKRNAHQAVSESLGLFYSKSLVAADYMDDFFQMTENQRYVGSKLVGPGINQGTAIAAIDNKPVVEVFNTNPNQLIYTQSPSQGDPGNLIVR